MVQTSQRQRRDGADPLAQPSRLARDKGGELSDELNEELRALIARWAPALKELEKH